MVRDDGLLNLFHSLNLSRLTHPTILLVFSNQKSNIVIEVLIRMTKRPGHKISGILSI